MKGTKSLITLILATLLLFSPECSVLASEGVTVNSEEIDVSIDNGMASDIIENSIEGSSENNGRDETGEDQQAEDSRTEALRDNNNPVEAKTENSFMLSEDNEVLTDEKGELSDDTTEEESIIASGNCGATDNDQVMWALIGTTDNLTLKISGNGAMANYSSYKSQPWFQYRQNIKELELCDGITSIGDLSFADFRSIESVSIPNSVTSIGVSSFNACIQMKSISIPDSVSTIGAAAFYCCHKLEAIAIPNALTKIEKNTFVQCDSLVTVEIPSSIKIIGEAAFASCVNLSQISIPYGVNTIGESVFKNCDSLESITIPDSVSTIDNYAFEDCDSLVDVTLPSRLQKISPGLFSGCRNMTTITIPETVTTIEHSAFMNCHKLSYIDIPQRVNSIGSDAFACTGIINITIPDGVTAINAMTFAYCNKLQNIIIPPSVKRIEKMAFAGCSNLVTDIVIPDGMETIKEETFSGCEKLTTISIPESVTTIEERAFENCKALKNINIPSGVEHIGDNAFMYCSSLTNVLIPCNVDFQVFWGCSSLEKITFSEKVSYLSNYEFYGCGIKSICIPSNIKKIYDGTFENCSGLKDIYFMGTPPNPFKTCFEGVTATAYYPENDSTWTEDVRQNYGGTITWVPWDPTEPPSGKMFEPVEPALITGTDAIFKFRSMLKDDDSIEYTFDYDDRWVFSDDPADRYKLMQTSIRVAMAAFGAKDDNWSGPANIIDMMDTMGFDHTGVTTEREVSDYSGLSIIYPEPVEKRKNTIGSAIGLKNIKNPDGSFTSIILVAVRGGGYGAEWGDNFYVGDDMRDSAGFRVAANQVDNRLKSFMEENSQYISDEPYIWLTGFSRAAATSNLVAADLINGTCQIEGISPDNVLAFCFECPRTTTDSNADDEMYGNILSIVNPLDFVPKVPMKFWGFTRYGFTAYLPSPETMSNYIEKKNPAIEKYLELFNYNSIPFNEMVIMEGIGQASLLDSFTDHLSFFIQRSLYREMVEDGMIDIAASGLGNTGSPDWGVAIPSLIDAAMTALIRPFTTTEVVSLFVVDRKFGPGANAHFPQLCMSWIDSMSGFDQFFWNENSLYRKVLINCPVDVTVHDSTGTVVGHIENDEVEEIEGGIVARIDLDGQKTFILPQDEEYTIDIIATDDGKVNYTITEYNFDSNTTEKVINFKNIEVIAGDELQGSASEVPDEDEAEYTLQYKEDETPILPDEIMSGDEVIEFSVEITTEGNGTLTGGGSYVKGEFAKVTAEPAEGFVFTGWYNGDSCVSTETEYRFAVTEDVQLVAKFTQDQSIQLDKSEMTVKTGREYKLTATVSPDNGQQINWESSDPAVAKVDQDGTVTGLKSGTATVTANVEDSGVSASCEVTVIGGSWKKDNTGWWYLWEDGSYPKSEFILIGGVTYYFNPSGYMVTGWRSIDGKWYYFNASGAMMTGWQRLGGVWYYMNSSGAMVTGWQSIGGVWYYFNSSGAMQTGWRQLGGVWYYMNASGAMVTGWQSIGGKWYYFNASGAMMTGWQQIGDVWYYMNSSGTMVTGWLQLGNTWYYMNASGAMVTGRQQIDGTWYTFSSSGAMQ